jgi:hypothetical protein
MRATFHQRYENGQRSKVPKSNENLINRKSKKGQKPSGHGRDNETKTTPWGGI